MALDPKKHPDWEIAKDAEKNMKPIYQIGKELGLKQDEILPYGSYVAKLDYKKIIERIKDNPKGKYIIVTAITPTPLGEGKSTTTMGLVQGLSKKGKKATAAIRQPSGGPTMNIKGSAAGGGLSQCIPLSKFSLGLTGDINAIMNSHNLCMTALNARMQHEANYSDEELCLRKLKRLDIDPQNVQMGFILDFCVQALREIEIGIGGKNDGFRMKSRFDIAVSSEIMAILAVSKDLKDFRERISKIVVAYDKKGNTVTAKDLEVDGAMAAWMVEAFNPNLMQTIEGVPVIVHAGPFANIAIGQSSVIADLLGIKLSEYHVTEAGFGADIGFEKFWNLKCRYSGLTPDAAVIVATIRALKCHGGAPLPVPGKPLPKEYETENLEWVKKGCENLLHHINTVKLSGITPVVCLNAFSKDTDKEINLVMEIAKKAGAKAAVSKHWEKGGEGALKLADAVIEACSEKNKFNFLYSPKDTLKRKIELIATKVYGADGVDYYEKALLKVNELENQKDISDFGVCMAKTHLSLSDDASKKGAPKGWKLFIRDLLVYRGAGFVVPVAGEIKLMPGTSSDPAFRRIDIDTETGEVKGLF